MGLWPRRWSQQLCLLPRPCAGYAWGTVLLVLANQTRREMGLPDVAVYDTDLAVKTAVASIGQLIQVDKNKK